MSRFTVRRALAVVALAAAVAPVAVLAGPNNVPFKASLVTQEILHPDPAACQAFPFLAGTTTGTGHGSHLGAVTGTGSDCVTPMTTGQFTFGNGKLTFVSASGDELHAEYGGTLSPTATASIYAISGTYRITGGTGRFGTASGSGTLSGVENLTTLQGQLNFTGVLSY